ncbi:hypothetical protein [Paenibacillus amylolyticus]|uniref:hypothetical protein n=1 Tax=Paenibacillus amylolyticus TaxID=1451 RepID=UPI003398EC52
MNIKKVLSGSIVAMSLILSAGSALASSSPGDAIAVPQTIDGSFSTISVAKPTQPPVITPMATYTPIDNESLTTGNGTKSVYFDTNSTYPWYRIYVSNNSNVKYKIQLSSDNGTDQGSFEVNGNSGTIIRNNNAATGRRYVSVTSVDGSNLRGIIHVRLGEFKSEVAN